jgi:hypothetical protein
VAPFCVPPPVTAITRVRARRRSSGLIVVATVEFVD